MKRSFIVAASALSLAACAQLGCGSFARNRPAESGAPQKASGESARPPQDAAKKIPDLSPLQSPYSWRGQDCGATQATHFIIEDAANWASLWKGYLHAEAPRVDFSKHLAACVFLGMRSTGGYDVEFLSPLLDEKTALLRFRVLKPGPKDRVTQAFTAPYALRLYRKSGLTARLEEAP